MPPTMVIMAINILRIPLPKFHDGDDVVTYIGRLTKVCVMHSEDIDVHKLQYFPKTLQGKSVSWFTCYEMAILATT